MREKAKKFMSEKVERRPGKQPGAAGAALARAEVTDHRELHVPTSAVVVGKAWMAPRSSAAKPARSTTCPYGAWR